MIIATPYRQKSRTGSDSARQVFICEQAPGRWRVMLKCPDGKLVNATTANHGWRGGGYDQAQAWIDRQVAAGIFEVMPTT